MRVRFRWPRLPIGEGMRVFGQFAHHVRPHRGTLLVGALCLLGTALVELARPWPLKIVFDYVLFPDRGVSNWPFLAALSGRDPLVLLGLASAGLLAIAALVGLFNYGQRVLLTGVGHRVAGAIRLQLFTHIQQLPQSYHDYRHTGDLMMRMTGDINMLKDLLVSVVLKIGSRLVIVVGMLAAMFWMDAGLTLIALGVIPALLIINLHFSSRIKSASRRQRRMAGELAATIHDNISGLDLIRAFTQERRQARKFGKRVTSDVKAGLKIVRLEVSFSRTVEIITALGMGAVLWFGVRRVMAGTLSAGDLMIFLSYMRMVYRPLRDVANQSTRMAKAIASGQRILEILQIKTGVEDEPGARKAGSITGDVQFRAVDFAYSAGHPVLHSVSCRIPANRTTLIVGPSGAGKSTVAKLLVRLYEPTGGDIFLDGCSVRRYRLQSLRKQVTSLAQEVTMFHATIRDNIGFGNPRKDNGAIAAAARKVGAHRFIEALPDGYDTVVGEGGLTLSGGQRQRLAFARAALRGSKIMIFDEPASGLDPVAEREAKDALAALKGEHTIIIITHRLNFLDLADHVILMQEGRVAEEGEPGALSANGGPFAEFLQHWRTQVGQLPSPERETARE